MMGTETTDIEQYMYTLLAALIAEEERSGCFTLCSSCHVTVNVLCLFLLMLWVGMWFVIVTLPGLEFIKLEFVLRLKIKRKNWLLADVSASIKIKRNDWLLVSASSQSLRYILSLRLYLSFTTSRPHLLLSML